MLGPQVLKVIILPLSQGMSIHPIEVHVVRMVTEGQLHCLRVLGVLSKMPDWHSSATPVPVQVLLVYDANTSWCKDHGLLCLLIV